MKNKNEITSLENLELNLEEIKDENIRKSIQFVFNITEAQAAQIKKLQEENQKLRDENNLLKGEQGKPDIKPKNNGKGGGNVSSEKDRKQPENKPPKKRAPKFKSLAFTHKKHMRFIRLHAVNVTMIRIINLWI